MSLSLPPNVYLIIKLILIIEVGKKSRNEIGQKTVLLVTSALHIQYPFKHFRFDEHFPPIFMIWETTRGVQQHDLEYN